MKTKLFFTVLFFILIFKNSFAQVEFEVKIFDSSIQTAPVHDCGEVKNNSQEMLTYTIKNERKTDVEIKNIKIPQGYMASASSMEIDAKDEITLYIFLDTSFIEKTGEFSEKVVIETNLIQNIEIQIKGVYLE